MPEPITPQALASTPASGATPPGATSGAAAVPTVPGPTVPPQARRGAPVDQTRDTAESIVIAFILAFLFRAFEAEAFVIPTGSMAPTLYGAHKDIVCTQCQFHYTVGASDDLGSNSVLMSGNRVHTSICPNCQHPEDIFTNQIFKGDRILVNKFPFEVGEPTRWDVIVFKYPEEAKTNYIKRLVGLPGEELMISSGDVFVRKTEADPFRIPRKPLEKQLRILQAVHDDTQVPKRLLESGWPERWQPSPGAKWNHDAQARSFRIDPDPATASQWHELRYQHIVPRPVDWSRALKPEAGAVEPPEPTLITDFYGYNARINASWDGEAPRLNDQSDPDRLPVHGLHWVGDLSLRLNLEVIAAQGTWRCELVEGRRRYAAEVDLKTGNVVLKYHDDLWGESAPEQPLGEATPSPLSRPGTYAIQFINLDDRVALLVDGVVVKAVEFEPGSKFPPHVEGGLVLPTQADLSPVGIAARGASVRVENLVIERDVYYTYTNPRGGQEYAEAPSAAEHWRLLARPAEFTERYENSRQTCRFTLVDHEDPAEDEFFALGDNSPRSKDSRAWDHSHAVPRRLLVGKAFYIYWPHMVPFGGPDGNGFPVAFYKESGRHGPEVSNVPWLSLPCYPQISRMKRIR